MEVGLRSHASWNIPRLACGVFVAFCLSASLTRAQDLVHVEEDWQLVVGEPDSNTAGPQIACTMSPFGDINGLYFTHEVNHQSMPYWAPGGLTIHQWSGESVVQSMTSLENGYLPVATATLHPAAVLDYDLYLQRPGRQHAELYRGSSYPLGATDLDRLRAEGVDHLYVRMEEADVYREYLCKHAPPPSGSKRLRKTQPRTNAGSRRKVHGRRW